MRNQETGLDYANTDPSLHYNRIEPQPDKSWRDEWLAALKRCDFDAAQAIYDANNQSLECEYGDHDYCRSERCSCVHHRATSFPAQGAALKSCAEIASEESEEAA